MVVVWTIRTLLAWLVVGVILIIAMLLSVLTFQRFQIPLWHRVARLVGKTFLRIVGIKIVELNDNPFSDAQPRIVIFNHQSLLDIFWMSAVSPPGMSSVAKKSFKYIPILNLAFWLSGQIFIDRSSRVQSIRAMSRLMDRVREERRSMHIAPEGTRSPDGKIQSFKKGAFHMAIQSQFPMHMLVVCGAWKLMKPGQLYAKPGVLTIRHLPPFDTTSWAKETLREHMALVHSKMVQCHAEMKTNHPD